MCYVLDAVNTFQSMEKKKKSVKITFMISKPTNKFLRPFSNCILEIQTLTGIHLPSHK